MTIYEPATLLTDYLLTVLGGFLAWRLWRDRVISVSSVRWWYRSLVVLSCSAFVGGSYHGFAPNFDHGVDEIWWRSVLWIICLLGFTMGSALVCEWVPKKRRTFFRQFLCAKFLLVSVVVLVVPDFRVAIVDYGLAMSAWLAAALVLKRQWRGWITAAVLLSGAAAVVQQSGLGWWHVLNHNDLFHLIQAFALIAFYRGALQMSGVGGQATPGLS